MIDRSQFSLKKTLHPVYVAENKRTRKKVRQVKDDPVNEGKTRKIENGIVKIDKISVERNTFFS